MNETSNSTLLGFAVLAVTVSFCLTAHAANPCQPVFDALDKVTTTPKHTYSSLTAVFTHGQPRESETIVANGKVYIRVNGKWRGMTIGQVKLRSPANSFVPSARVLAVQSARSLRIINLPSV